MNYTIEELEKSWNFYDNAAKEIIDNAVNISFKFIDNEMIKTYEDYIEKNNFQEDYDFNIFELMSDKFYRENFHSYIIAQLFKSDIILKKFLGFIKVDETIYLNDGYDIIPEYSIKHEIKNGRIDILIKSNDKENNEDEENENKEKPHCIIIENKLHGAKDEESQLRRYYEACSESFEVDKIVYLLPNLDKKNKPDEQSKEGIPKELIKTIVGYDGNGKDFYTVLNDSLEEVKSNIEWHLLLKHYLKILRLTGETKMDALTEKFYEKIKKEPQEYEKIKLIANMYNDLIKTRINYFAKEFNGETHYKNNDNHFIRDFPSEKRGISYAIVIYMDDNYSWLSLFSREEDNKDNNKKSKEKWEQDNKDIEAWLKKHKLFEGFYFDGRWTGQFEFPEEENALYEFTKKLIKCLEEDVESIYSGK